MSRVLVIHPDDRSTDFLKLIYKDKDYDVINDPRLSKDFIKEQIKKHDKIIMMGHGTPGGLMNTTLGGYLIDDSFAPLLKEKESISIWCNSDGFFKRFGIKGFHTGMVISETYEAEYILGRCPFTKREMLDNMEYFATVVGKCIDKSPLEMQEYILDNYVGEDEVTKFNRSRMLVL